MRGVLAVRMRQNITKYTCGFVDRGRSRKALLDIVECGDLCVVCARKEQSVGNRS